MRSMLFALITGKGRSFTKLRRRLLQGPIKDHHLRQWALKIRFRHLLKLLFVSKGLTLLRLVVIKGRQSPLVMYHPRHLVSRALVI